MWSTLKTTARLRAIDSSPMLFTNAGSWFQVVGAMFRTSWQTLVDLLVHLATPFALPPCLTVAFACNAGAMSTAAGIRTVGCNRNLQLLPRYFRLSQFGWRNFNDNCKTWLHQPLDSLLPNTDCEGRRWMDQLFKLWIRTIPLFLAFVSRGIPSYFSSERILWLFSYFLVWFAQVSNFPAVSKKIERDRKG